MSFGIVRNLSRWVAAALLVISPPLFADDNSESLVAALREHRMEMQVSDGMLRGPGAQWLLQRAALAQFVLIGEDHGFTDVPEFAQALQNALGERRFDHLVLETGALATERVERTLRGDSGALTSLNGRFPFFLPFLSQREDGLLASDFVKKGTSGPVLWGIDQEFVLSIQFHLQTLQDLARSDAQRQVLRNYRRLADRAWREMIDKHSPGAMVLLHWQPGDFATLRRSFDADRDREACALIDALAASAEIYQTQNSKPYESNLARSRLMKRQFVHYYSAAAAGGTLPRAMFKMGAFHAGRGLSPTRLFDIGNLASELAQFNGQTSLHVLVLASAGEVNVHRPFSADRKDQHAAYVAAEELKQLDAQPLLDAASADSVVVYDLSALRGYDQPHPAAGSALAAVIHNYDAVVMIPRARAATNYP